MKVSVWSDGVDGEVRCQETGEQLFGVTEVGILMKVGQETIARCELLAGEVGVEAEAMFSLLDPETGLMRQVKAIEWADGERVEL